MRRRFANQSEILNREKLIFLKLLFAKINSRIGVLVKLARSVFR